MDRRPSPNFDARPGCGGPDMLLLHYTGMASAEAALVHMCDPAAKVSAHYMIGEDGTLTALVEEGERAWHAGVASWHGESDINACSIGIELVNPGTDLGYRDFPEAQMVALEGLARDIIVRHDIAAPRVLAHSDVAPGRKIDPGARFDWRRLADAGIGLWPGDLGPGDEAAALAPGADGAGVAFLQAQLAAYGYAVPDHGRYDDDTAAVVRAFQRHFRSSRVDGVADGETQVTLAALLDLLSDT